LIAPKRPSRFQIAKAPPVIKISFIKKEGVATTLFLHTKKYKTKRRTNPLRKMYRGAKAGSSGVVEYINEMMSNRPVSQFIMLSIPVGVDEVFDPKAVGSFIATALLPVVRNFFLLMFEN
jgi:hypothetical protein